MPGTLRDLRDNRWDAVGVQLSWAGLVRTGREMEKSGNALRPQSKVNGFKPGKSRSVGRKDAAGDGSCRTARTGVDLPLSLTGALF